MKKKLIEVALPLEAINRESVRHQGRPLVSGQRRPGAIMPRAKTQFRAIKTQFNAADLLFSMIYARTNTQSAGPRRSARWFPSNATPGGAV